jgi:hypothetical protein
MVHSLADLELAIRHVRDGRARIDRQRELLMQLRLWRCGTAEAENLLALMETSQGYMVEHAKAIEADFKKPEQAAEEA